MEKSKKLALGLLLIAFLLATPSSFGAATASNDGKYVYIAAKQECGSGPAAFEISPEEEKMIEEGLATIVEGDLEGLCNGDGETPDWSDEPACCGQICETFDASTSHCELKEEYQAYLDKTIIDKYLNQKKIIEEQSNLLLSREQEIEGRNVEITNQKNKIIQLTDQASLMRTGMIGIIFVLIVSLIGNILLARKTKRK